MRDSVWLIFTNYVFTHQSPEHQSPRALIGMQGKAYHAFMFCPMNFFEISCYHRNAFKIKCMLKNTLTLTSLCK